MKKLFLILFFASCYSGFGQGLKPSIGIGSLPPDNTPICKIPWYLGSFNTSGYKKGDSVPDFKLYSLNGDSLVLSDALKKGKPVLLINGSLTCPVFMGKIPTINSIVSNYGSLINVYVVYTVEAHPTDTSPYFGYINTTQSNVSKGILFKQPTTYGGRKKLVDTLKSWASLSCPIFIDGPCNNWWLNYGPAPNNSYIIGADGKVKSKHGWFHKSPDNIFCDLDTILGVTKGLCTPVGGGGTGGFITNFKDSILKGNVGEIIFTGGMIYNNTIAPVTITAMRLQSILPSGWKTSFCADVCYPEAQDTIVFSVPGNDSLKFTLDFLPTTYDDTGSVRVGLRNNANTNNRMIVWFRAISNVKKDTLTTSSLLELNKSVSIYPLPFSNTLTISLDGLNSNVAEISLFDLMGNKILNQIESPAHGSLKSTWLVDDLPLGLYYLTIEQEGGKKEVRKLIKQ